ncbi:MAG: DNA-processing protein DprA [Thermomicrobiales bacterium]
MIANRTVVTLLMTLRTGPTATLDPKPLDVTEWNTLARWLAQLDLAPEDLATVDGDRILDDWPDGRIDAKRLHTLLGRYDELQPLLDRWRSLGIWIIGRSDESYPQRIRQRLGDSAPTILFGLGEPRLLANPGLALVGSRNASTEENLRAFGYGQQAAESGYTVVSGGARGIDTHSEQGAFDAGGTVVSILGDSLVLASRKSTLRDHLEVGDLALITPYSPDAGFSSGNAMGRNRLIYCLAEAAIAVCSTLGRGGTFAGASEAIRRGWVPVWAPRSANPESGNDVLIDLGAHELPSDRAFTIATLAEAPVSNQKPAPGQTSLFGS